MFKLIEAIFLSVGNLFAKGAGRVTKTILTTIDTIVSKISEAFAWAFVGFFLYTLIVDVLLQGSPELQAKASLLVGRVISNPAATARMLAAPVDNFFETASAEVGDFIFNKILNIFTPQTPPTPETAKDAAQAFFGHLSLIAITSWMSRSFADVLSLGKFESIGELPEKLDRTLKLGRLAPALLADPIDVMVSKPLAQGYLRRYTPNPLTATQIIDLTAQGLLSLEQYKDLMLSHGFNEEASFLLARLRVRKFSAGDLKKLFDRQIIDEEQLRQGLKRLEYVDEDIELILQLILQDRVFSLTEDIAKEALNLFETGQITETSTRSFLREASWHSNEIDLGIQLANLKKLRADLTSSQLLNMMSEGLFTESQVLLRLRNKGFDDDDAQAMIAYEKLTSGKAQPTGAITKEVHLTQSQILTAYRKGLLSQDDVVERLTAQGVVNEDIQILLQLNAPTQ